MKKELRVLRFVLALGFFTFSTVVQGQDLSSEEIDAMNLDIEEVVVTSTGTQRRLSESASPIAIITAKELERANVTTLDEALEKLSSSFTTMTNTMGTTVSLNGLTDDYFIFLENGRKIEGDNPFLRINLSNVKRIEILSGASAALYGTSAIGGVVNIITETGSNSGSIDASSYTRYSSKNRLTQSLDFDATVGKFVSSTSYRYQQADSWQLSPYVLDDDILEPTEKIASTGFKRNTVSQNFGYNVNDKLSLNVGGSFYDYKTERPYSIYYYDLNHEDYGLSAGVSYKLNSQDMLILDYNSDNYTSAYKYFKDYSKSDKYAGDYDVRKRTHYNNVNLKGIFNLGTHNILSVGAEFRKNTLSSATDDIDFEKANTYAIFAQDEINITDNLQAVVGARYTYHETFKSYITPNGSLIYHLGNLNLRATYASGFKTPELSDIYSTGVTYTDLIILPNQDLKPEKSNYFSFSAEYNKKWFSISATAFYNKLYDMIDYTVIAVGDEAQEGWGVEEVKIRDNVSEADVKGLNIAVNASLGGGFSINGGYTYLDTYDYETTNPIDKSAKNVFVATASWSNTWKKYTLNVDINGRVSSRRYSKTYGYAPAYQIWNLNTSHTFKFQSFELEPGIGVENIFNYIDDRPWNSNYATLNPGRALYGSLLIRF